MLANTTIRVSTGLDREPRKLHPFATLELVPGAPASRLAGTESGPFLPLGVDQTHNANTMTWRPSATREDAIRLVARYVRVEFSIRSAAGRIAVDETRVPPRDRRGDVVDVESMSWIEILEAARNYKIRRAVYAPATAPIVRNDKGDRLLRVVAARDVAPIVRSRRTRKAGAALNHVRDWRATIAQKLGRLDRQEAIALVSAERIRIRLLETRNQLEDARRAAGRLRSGGRKARNLRRNADDIVAQLRSREEFDSDRLKRIVRTSDYRVGIDRLLTICTESEEVESYCFGEIR